MPTTFELRGDQYVRAVTPALAAGAAGEVPLLVLPADAKITGVRWVPGAAIVANGANYFTLTPRNRGAAGAGATVLTTPRAYSAGNGAAQVAETLALSGTAADLLAAAGDVLTAHFTHTGTGLAVPAGLVQVALQWR